MTRLTGYLSFTGVVLAVTAALAAAWVRQFGRSYPVPPMEELRASPHPHCLG